jgi:3-hydroxybutyryl-CoA dehydrogenase
VQTFGVPPPRKVAIVGAGTMGAGMAGVFALGGSEVRLAARTEATLGRARQRIESLAPDAAGGVMMTTAIEEALTEADLVVETIAEELDPKQRLLVLAERVAPAAVLTSNTSSLSLAALGSALGRPGRFAGLHWFNPPELVELVEVVGGAGTAPEVLDTLRDWMNALGKAPVVLRRDVPGFVANRLQYALLREAYALADSGVCSLDDIDRAVTHGIGARWAGIGPFEAMDLAGLDVHASVAANLYAVLANDRELSPRLVAAIKDGALGVKNGRGLRGEYDRDAAAEVVARRDRTLRGVQALRARAPHP